MKREKLAQNTSSSDDLIEVSGLREEDKVKKRPRFIIWASVIAALVFGSLLTAVLFNNYQSNKSIVIGDTKITKDDITKYAAEVRDYKQAHPNALLEGSLEQRALDDLVMNAALKYELKLKNISLSDKDLLQSSQEDPSDPDSQEKYLYALKKGNKFSQK